MESDNNGDHGCNAIVPYNACDIVQLVGWTAPMTITAPRDLVTHAISKLIPSDDSATVAHACFELSLASWNTAPRCPHRSACINALINDNAEHQQRIIGDANIAGTTRVDRKVVANTRSVFNATELLVS